jgi:hypothetical protein
MLERRAQRLEPTSVVEPDDEPNDWAGPHRALHFSDACAGSGAHGDGFGPHCSGPVYVPDPQEAGDAGVSRVRPELVRRRRLHDPAFPHHGDAIPQRERLRLIVGDVDGRLGELVEEIAEILEEAVAQPAVERAEGLVEKQRAGLRRESTREGDALALAAGQRPDGAVLEAIEADESEQVAHSSCDSLGWVPAHAQPERDVPEDVTVWKERVILEDEADPASVRRHRSEVDAVQQDPAGVRPLQARDHSQERRLPRPARPEDRDHLAGPDVKRRAVQGERLLEANADVLHPEHR